MHNKQRRIFQVISASANTAISENRTWHRNLYEPLIELGCDVFLFRAEPGKKALRTNNKKLRERFSQDLAATFEREHKRKPFDLFFSYIMDDMVTDYALQKIREHGVPMVNFSCNNAHQFDLVRRISPIFDLNLHSERDAQGKFRSVDANPLWWPMASNPKYFYPHPVPRDFDVTFVGANYGPRARIAAHLLEHGIDIRLFGPNWKNAARSSARSRLKSAWYTMGYLTTNDAQKKARLAGLLADHEFRVLLSKRHGHNMHPPLSDEQLIMVYSQSNISLGILEVFEDHDPTKSLIRHLHLREFEAPMCGALYCTGHTDELTEMFEPDKEVLTYKSYDELLDKVRYYLSNPKQGDKIRTAGLKRALADHTYQKRYITLFSELGI